MALIKCPECGKEYSEYASACPNCACPTEIAKKQGQKPVNTVTSKEKCNKEKPANTNIACQMSFDFSDGIVKGFTADNTVTVPSTINGKKVKEIGYEAFARCSFITNIIIEEGIEKIDRYAFIGCESVNQISIPNSINYIGWQALDCGNNVKYNEYDNALYLGNKNNPYLVLAKVKNNSVSGCAIHKDCRFIYSNTFQWLEGLATISIPKNVERIGEGAFQYCPSLETVTLSEGLKTIGADAFLECKSLKNINIPNSVIDIESGVFNNCKSLKRVILPEKITSIAYELFSGCSSLEEVFISKEVKEIAMRAFYNCSSLRRIYYTGTQKEWMSIKVNDSGNERLRGVEVIFSAK